MVFLFLFVSCCCHVGWFVFICQVLQSQCESQQCELLELKQDLQLVQAEGASFRDRSSALEVRRMM